MFDWLRRTILKLARVPGQPGAPAGAPGSVRIFRAGRNFYYLSLVGWGFAQIGAVGGIIASLWFLGNFTDQVDNFRSARPNATANASVTAESTAPAATPERKTKASRRNGHHLARKLAGWPDWTLSLITWAEYAAIVVFILQLPVTLAAVRLQYEQHWYIVTDRSLRIRTGLFSLQESTMSFANLQQVEVKQGPLQRLLRIADVHVQSAGGGGDGGQKGKTDDSMHHAIFQGVDNAHEIRDLILARLKKFRNSGLNDPDETTSEPSGDIPADETLTAARDLLAEIRKLRETLQA